MKYFFTAILFFFFVAAKGQTCASYSSAFPPPFPETYPCLEDFFNAQIDNYCCDVAFDQYCIEQLKLHCDISTNVCKFETCEPSGCTATSFPFCPNVCPSYNTLNPPPGDNPPTYLDGIIYEVIYF